MSKNVGEHSAMNKKGGGDSLNPSKLYFYYQKCAECFKCIDTFNYAGGKSWNYAKNEMKH